MKNLIITIVSVLFCFATFSETDLEKNSCLPVTSICRSDLDCCTDYCLDSRCIVKNNECLVLEAECRSDNDCCSNYCYAKQCVEK